jgi:Tol biopolymer transport system component
MRADQQRGLALRRVWDGHASGLTAAVLTTIAGDGRRLAYQPFATGTVNVHDLTTGTDRPVTVADGCGGAPAISRDGTLVAYERYCGAYGNELRLVHVQGSGVSASRLLYESPDVVQITPMDVSPDNSSIAVMLGRKDQTRQIGLVATESGALRVLKSIDWRGPSRIFFSPDGQDLAYDLPASDTGHQRDVFVLAVDGSREVPAVVHPSNDIVMGWSPDGTHLLFASDRRSGAMGLWALAIADRKPHGAPVLITESINSAWSMGVTSNGALYVGLSATDRDIAVAPIDLTIGSQTGPTVKPIQSFSGTNLEATWSPDGKFLAYLSQRSHNRINIDPRILAIRSVDTGETRELLPNLSYFDQMSWAPDSRALVTGGGDLKGRLGIYRIDAQTGDVALIVSIPQGAGNAYPQWSPDGKHIYYRRPLTDDVRNRDVAFVERNLASGQEREVARGALGSISLSPDGRTIVAHKADSTGKSSALVLIPVAGGETRELVPPSQDQGILRFSGIPWTPDGRAVIVRKILSGGIRESTSELWLVPIAGASPRKLDIDTNQWAAGNWGVISLRPDGRQIAFLSGQLNSEVWVLENFLPLLKGRR